MIIVVLFIVITLYGFNNDLDVDLSPQTSKEKIKVIGIGLPRTGTCSLSKALTILGYSVQHFPLNIKSKWREYLTKRDAIVDITMLGFRPKELFEKFPEAIFIYTKRDNESWVKSMKQLYKTFCRLSFIPGVARVLDNFVTTFGTNSKSFTKAKKKYEEEIFKYGHNINLHTLSLSSNLSDKQKWIAIGKALNMKITSTSQSFPHVHHISLHIEQIWRCILPKCTFFKNIHI